MEEQAKDIAVSAWLLTAEKKADKLCIEYV